jgi:hypothetical protein
LVTILLPDREEVFAGHLTHVAANVAAVVVEYVPSAHCKHGRDPFTLLYVPGTQALHSCPAGPVYPALHTQSVL